MPAPSFDLERDLPYFVEWRPALWAPVVRWLIGDPRRFRGKRVLDLGCRFGRMSCLFGLLGASVQGVDLDETSLELASKETRRWGLAGSVKLAAYDGQPGNIPGDAYDFVFTKSVLVVVPSLRMFLAGLAPKLAGGAELLFAENMSGGRLLGLVRRFVIHRRWSGFGDRFRGVDDEFMHAVRDSYDVLETKKRLGLVMGIRARRFDSR